MREKSDQLLGILGETFPPNCRGFGCAGLKLVQNIHLVVLSYLLVKKCRESMFVDGYSVFAKSKNLETA